MFTTANDSTVCLPFPVTDLEPVVDPVVEPAVELYGFDDVLTELVAYERSARPVVVSRVEVAWPGPMNRATSLPVSHAERVRVVPRVWTVFLTLALTIGVILVTQIGLVILLALGLAASGVASEDLTSRLLELIGHPAGFIGLGLVAQLVMGMAAVFPAMFSRHPFRQRLGLVSAKLPTWGYAVVMIGSLVPASLGFVAAGLVAEVLPVGDSMVADLYENMTLGWAIPFVLFISLAPGLMEELLFRGYLQTRLLERWKPGFAIVVSSAFFALFHITPHGMALAFVAGLFLGVLAWRTGSIWPGVLCHAFINGSVNVLRLGVKFGAWSGSLTGVVGITLMGLALICFAVTLWLIVQAPTRFSRRDTQSIGHQTRSSVGLAQA